MPRASRIPCGLDGTLRFRSFAGHGLSYPQWPSAAPAAFSGHRSSSKSGAAAASASAAAAAHVPQRRDAVLALGGGGCAVFYFLKSSWMFWSAPFYMCAIRRVNEAHSKLQLNRLCSNK
jgi:hypothetical protein